MPALTVPFLKVTLRLNPTATLSLTAQALAQSTASDWRRELTPAFQRTEIPVIKSTSTGRDGHESTKATGCKRRQAGSWSLTETKPYYFLGIGEILANLRPHEQGKRILFASNQADTTIPRIELPFKKGVTLNGSSNL